MTVSFDAIGRALDAAGVTQPTLVIDRAALDANLDFVSAGLPADMSLRIVAKSLPSPQLIDYACQRLGTQRLMTFNLPMLCELATLRPDRDQLLGKPFPVAAAAAFLRDHADAAERVHWLIDTVERLREYGALAAQNSTRLNVALELDVGLHRGGFAPGEALNEALRVLAESKGLRLTGLVGYEAHVSKVPDVLGWRERVFSKALAAYREALAAVDAVLGAGSTDGLIRNAAGSPTFRRYKDASVANELALGSVLVKPSDFDIDGLEGAQPAAWIAAPVLKVAKPLQTPVLEALDAPRRWFGRQQAVCIHGGYWQADPVHPPGLGYDATFGRSSNQEVLVGGRDVQVKPGDWVFLRPTQSERVLGQLGPIAVYGDGVIQETWPVFPQSG